MALRRVRAVIAAMVLLGHGGCGGSSDDSSPAPPPPPMAVKDVQFGAGMVTVRNRIGELKEILREGPLSIYRFEPAEADNRTRQRTPVQFYDFHFHREELAEVQVLYDLDELQAEIGRDTFFRTIEERYQTKEDFNAPDGRRWINMDKGVEVRWREDFEHDSGRLTITWIERKDAIEAARKSLRGRLKDEQDSGDGDDNGGVDIGI
ncbi:MAG: hypothetical protein ACOCWJ_00625 [Verrucomicrobiota bacterium]